MVGGLVLFCSSCIEGSFWGLIWLIWELFLGRKKSWREMVKSEKCLKNVCYNYLLRERKIKSYCKIDNEKFTWFVTSS